MLGREASLPRGEEQGSRRDGGLGARVLVEKDGTREAAWVEAAALTVDVAPEQLRGVAREAEELHAAAMAAFAERGGFLEQTAR